MDRVLITLHGRIVEPTVEEIMEEYGVQPDQIDLEYGVQMIDPAAGDYVILVDEDVALRIGRDQVGASGPYADVRIEPFGPPEG